MKTKIQAATEHMTVMDAIHPKPKPTKERKPKRVPVDKRRKRLDPDQWFSLCVRERAGWKCECCGKDYTPTISENTGLPGNPGLHCSHYIGRANYAVRFDPYNAVAHCYGCHAKAEGNPHNFMKWTHDRLGVWLYDLLIEKSNNLILGKQARKEKQEIAQHYKAEFERIRNSNNKQFEGYL